MRKVLALFLVVVFLFANEYNDDDLDGVPNYLDRCPNTPFSDIVDEYGCSIERLVRPKRLEYFFEYIYARDSKKNFKENDYLFTLTLYRGNFDLTLSSFYFDNRYKKGFADMSIKGEYRFTPTPMWDLYLGLAVDIPIFNVHGNRVDYTLFISNEYYFLGYKLFGGVYATRTEDRLGSKKLKNSYGGYGGIEFYYHRWSFDLVYLYNRSKFEAISNMLYVKAERVLKKNYFLFGTYTAGLNENAIDAIFSIGFGRRF